MDRVKLGQTGIEVSRLCLGTMTWGTQNTEAEGHEQADYALDRGVSFWDTAEMYPTNPVLAETVGNTERIIGNWLKARGGRDRVEIATKLAGPGRIIREGAPMTGATLRAGVEASLQRLQTDYIDLYQLHWPNRGSYHFRQIWGYAPTKVRRSDVEGHIQDMLGTAQDLVKEGKIRAIGLSNESVWGMSLWREVARKAGLPLMATVQNEYSLLCRQFDSDWAEMSVAEDIPLLAFSPLAAGLLSGKYAGDVTPDRTRRAATPDLGGRITPQVFPAVAAYMGIANAAGLDPCQMAIAFCLGRPFPCIPIIGATTMEQLETNIGAADVVLDASVMAEIGAAHRLHPMPY